MGYLLIRKYEGVSYSCSVLTFVVMATDNSSQFNLMDGSIILQSQKLALSMDV